MATLRAGSCAGLTDLTRSHPSPGTRYRVRPLEPDGQLA